MPRRKSDSCRRSDTTNAQFVLKDGFETKNSAPASSLPPAAPPPPPPPPATAAAEMETDRPGDSVPPTDKEKKEGREAVTIEDLTLPKSIITRLAKGVLPPNTQIQTNAVLAMSKSATVFINHLANAANEHTKNANKKTIMPNDVFTALEDIEFPFLREALEAEFKKFNEVQTTKRNTYRRKVAAAKAGKAAPEADAGAAAAKSPATPSAANAKSDPKASTLSAATATGGPASAAAAAAAPRSKKQKPNGPDDSRMDVDGGANGNAGEEDHDHDPSDADTEPDQEHNEEDDDDDDEGEEEGEGDEDEQDEDSNDDIMREAMEEKDDNNDDDGDEALDDGADSD